MQKPANCSRLFQGPKQATRSLPPSAEDESVRPASTPPCTLPPLDRNWKPYPSLRSLRQQVNNATRSIKERESYRIELHKSTARSFPLVRNAIPASKSVKRSCTVSVCTS